MSYREKWRRYTYIDPAVAEAVPPNRELSRLGAPSLPGEVKGDVWGAQKRS
jgi:hypothetical protein